MNRVQPMDSISVADVLAAVDIVDVVGAVVTLKKRGSSHVGLCPFHDEKTPSFYVNKDKQFFHCFGCGAAGDAIAFVRQHRGVGFVEACEALAGGRLVRVDATARAEAKARADEAARLRDAEQQRLHMEVAEKAQRLWEKARPADTAHPYLQAKQARGYGLRQLRNALLAPVRDASGRLLSLQFIQADGSKKFLTSGQVAGGYCSAGKTGDVLLICEGVATRDRLIEATGHAGAAAFNAGNLLAVAQAIRAKCPSKKLVICADNDQHKSSGNVGVEKAREAAKAVGGYLAIPEFMDLSSQPTDFNDLAALEGLGAVRGIIEAALSQAPAEKTGAEPLPPPALGSTDGVIDIEAETQARRDFEAKIEACGDFEQLVYVLYPAIQASRLRSPTKAALAKRLGKKAGVSVAELQAQSGGSAPPRHPSRHDGEEWVARMNEIHAVITQNGSTRIMNVEHDPVFDRRLVTFSSRGDFVLRYENRSAFINGEELDHGTAWLRNPGRREYRAIAFMPGMEMGAEFFNLWQGFGVEPLAEGSCAKFKRFVGKVICMGDPHTFRYVWAWLAHLVQRPGELPGTALVLRGLQGIGKNFFVDAIANIVNPAHYVALTSTEHLTGRFSAHRAGALLIFANEACWGGDRQSEGALKALVTDEDTLLEAKHKDAFKVRNFARLIVASNNAWPVPRDEDCRRFVVLDVLPTHKQDGPYFAELHEELQQGGYEKLLHELLNLNIQGWHPRKVPPLLLQRGWDMKLHGSSMIEWYYEALEEGFVCYVGDGRHYARAWAEEIPTSRVQEAYSAWCRRHGKFAENINQLGMALGRWGVVKRRLSDGTRPWVYVFRGGESERTLPAGKSFLDMARRAFLRAINAPEDYWEGDGD